LAAPHAGHHHAERHQARADRVMGRFVRAFRHHDHVHQHGGEAEAVAELLDREEAADDAKVLRLRGRQVHEHEIGQVHGKHHQPQAAFQAQARDQVTAEQAADGQRDDADGAVRGAVLLGREAQAARADRVLQEGGDEFQQLRLAQAERQNKTEDQPDVALAEEAGE
ncbi:conserved hypothetical protein, partial [Ricinus communis]